MTDGALFDDEVVDDDLGYLPDDPSLEALIPHVDSWRRNAYAYGGNLDAVCAATGRYLRILAAIPQYERDVAEALVFTRVPEGRTRRAPAPHQGEPMTTTEPARFTKKPVTIEAMRWDGTAEGATPIIDWILQNDGTARYECSDPERCAKFDGDCPHDIAIDTIEGTMRATIGDWIIRGIQGEFYPCKPDIFAATYDPTPPTLVIPEMSDEELEALRDQMLASRGQPPVVLDDGLTVEDEGGGAWRP